MAGQSLLVRVRRGALLAVAAWLPALVVLAQPAPPPTAPPAGWSQRSPDERLRAWQAMSSEERAAARRGARQDGPPAWQSLSPEQRAQVWQSLSPEQRAALLERVGPGSGWQALSPGERERTWRQLSPEQKAEIRSRMTPEQREALRNRFLEERGRRMAEDPECCGAEGLQNRRLSPEERQRLRDQVREANRGYGPMGPGGGRPPSPRP